MFKYVAPALVLVSYTMAIKGDGFDIPTPSAASIEHLKGLTAE